MKHPIKRPRRKGKAWAWNKAKRALRKEMVRAAGSGIRWQPWAIEELQACTLGTRELRIPRSWRADA